MPGIIFDRIEIIDDDEKSKSFMNKILEQIKNTDPSFVVTPTLKKLAG